MRTAIPDSTPLPFWRHPRVACMAHIRRKFVDVHPGSAIAEESIKRIGALRYRERGPWIAAGSAYRGQAEARPVFDDLGNWLGAQLPAISGKSPLAGAIRYALCHGSGHTLNMAISRSTIMRPSGPSEVLLWGARTTSSLDHRQAAKPQPSPIR